MSNAFENFDARLRKIDRNRMRLADGYSAKVTKDGLIVFRPKRRARGFSVRGLVFLLAGCFLFKALILTHLGPNTYEQRVTALRSGTVIEQAGAFVMQKDPVTLTLAQYVRKVVN